MTINTLLWMVFSFILYQNHMICAVIELRTLLFLLTDGCLEVHFENNKQPETAKLQSSLSTITTASCLSFSVLWTEWNMVSFHDGTIMISTYVSIIILSKCKLKSCYHAVVRCRKQKADRCLEDVWCHWLALLFPTAHILVCCMFLWLLSVSRNCPN